MGLRVLLCIEFLSYIVMTKLALNDENTRICVWRDKEEGKGKGGGTRGKQTKVEKTLESQIYPCAQTQGFLSHSKSQMIQGIDQRVCRGEIHRAISSYHEFNRGQSSALFT